MPAPSPQTPGEPISPERRWLAFGVHIFTASGVFWGFLALIAAAHQDWRTMFGWLALALFVDGIDGTIARKINVVEAAPRWSGTALDLIIDYLTYVIVPAYALYSSGMLGSAGHPLNLIAMAVILLSSAMYFADNEMKTEDAWFKGFPAVWNLIIFYYFLLSPAQPTTLSMAIIFFVTLALGLLTFASFVFVHPLRVAKLRVPTLSFLVVWSILAITAIWENMDPAPWVVWGLCIIGLYFLILGYFRTAPTHDRPPQ
ncbi:CDP-alcohol phosphatidyltransferase family protein [Labrys miyagiensis]